MKLGCLNVYMYNMFFYQQLKYDEFVYQTNESNFFSNFRIW